MSIQRRLGDNVSCVTCGSKTSLTVRMLAKGLREQAHAVDVARSSRAALELANDNTYDLIVLDHGLSSPSA